MLISVRVQYPLNVDRLKQNLVLEEIWTTALLRSPLPIIQCCNTFGGTLRDTEHICVFIIGWESGDQFSPKDSGTV